MLSERAWKAWWIAAGVVGVLVVAAAALAIAFEPGFDSAAFRRAVIAEDHDEVETQARRAVQEDVLVGRTKDEIRALLGSPHTAVRTEWRWDVGVVNDVMGPGDQAWLILTFDPRTERVSGADVP
ncbi:MAG: hypothetical protein JHC95_15240 [Solirubrobacteraceae bacterium]|nr:hypothetical protein [Solirubrobacteraceae bacterium]